jgi:hypothetical protein
VETWLSRLQWPARLAGYGDGGVVRGVDIPHPAPCRILAIPAQQRIVDRMGLHSAAHALVVLQFALAARNNRGAIKSD